jgi:hypothetical protein
MDRQAILMTLDVILYFPETGIDMYYDDRLWRLFKRSNTPSTAYVEEGAPGLMNLDNVT